jgi:carboxyl-terminal processing protease
MDNSITPPGKWLKLLRQNGRKWIGVGLILIAFVSGIVVGNTRAAQGQVVSPETTTLFQPFWEAWNLMHQNYVDPLDDNALMQGALAGMMAAPGDKFTNYFDPVFYKSTSDQMNGQFSGIGATVKKDDKTGGIFVVSTIDGSPARKAGLLTDDLILTVDGLDITGLPESQIIAKVRGPDGTTVKLGIVRAGTTGQMVVPIVRGTITLPDVVTRMYQGNIGYISLSEFGNRAGVDFTAGLKKLNANNLKGLIFDLRGNPGGYLTAAVSIASEFLPTGSVLIERGRDGSSNTYPVTGKPLAPDVPLIVLIDGGSASASELVSGALQDAGRAKLVGLRSYGKGSVQIIEGLQNGGAAHITVARWFTPKGRTIQSVGLTPDIEIAPTDPVKSPDIPDLQLREALMILRGEL